MTENRFWNLLSKRLSGEASVEELEELDQLIRSHPGLAHSAHQLQHLWKTNGPDTHSYDSELAFEQHLNQLREQGIFLPELETPFSPDDTEAPRKRRKLAVVLLVAFLAAALGVFLWMNQGTPSGATGTRAVKSLSEVSTPPGSKTTKLVLPDSSVVWLNAGSKLTYNEQFGVTNRNTTLMGEAFFDVRKSAMPFIIRANGLQIKVLGTAFNVKSYPGEKTTETSLLRGRVEVTLDKRPGEKIFLRPNEKLVVANDPESPENGGQPKKEPKVAISGLTFTQDRTIVETSWMDNKLVFEDESFSELAHRMERWYNVTIEFQSPALANEKLTGSLTTETVQEALEALQITTGFHFTIKSNHIIITK